ncbi:MAG TPA: hypothetical protein VF184_05860 [Phycisphaeraceae bacterium]
MNEIGSGKDWRSQLKRRFGAKPADLTASLVLTTGTLRDYDELAAYHYLAQRPSPPTRVLVLRDPRLTVVGRYLQRRSKERVVGVLVESMPHLSCRMRNWALGDRYGTWLTPTQRAALLRDEVRCISRVVVHPQWRGLGLAVRLVRAALERPTTIFTEALAAMGRVHPFFRKAGMRAYRRPLHTSDARLLTAMETAGLTLLDLARADRAVERIEAMEPAKQRWLLRELKRWQRLHNPRRGCAVMSLIDQLRLAQARLMLQPVYYLYDRREGSAPVSDKATS